MEKLTLKLPILARSERTALLHDVVAQIAEERGYPATYHEQLDFDTRVDLCFAMREAFVVQAEYRLMLAEEEASLLEGLA